MVILILLGSPTRPILTVFWGIETRQNRAANHKNGKISAWSNNTQYLTVTSLCCIVNRRHFPISRKDRRLGGEVGDIVLLASQMTSVARTVHKHQESGCIPFLLTQLQESFYLTCNGNLGFFVIYMDLLLGFA